MTDHDDEIIQVATERFERGRAEECGSLRVDMTSESGKLRVEMQQGFGGIRIEMHQGFGAIRVEMADRNSELLKWLLIYGAAQTAALAAMMALLR